jgi:hypothetical protein
VIEGGGVEVDCGGADEELGDAPEPDVVAAPLVFPVELELEPALATDVVVVLDVVVVGFEPFCGNGSRPCPGRCDRPGFDTTLSAGSAVPCDGGVVPAGREATGVPLEDFDSAIGTATIATSITITSVQSRLPRS